MTGPEHAKVAELRSVSVRYGSLIAVRDATLVVERGDLIGISGANGAGKSTLLKAIAGVLPVAAGHVDWGIGTLDRHRPGSVRQRMALVPEGRALFSGMTVRDHLLFGAYVAKRRSSAETLGEVLALFPRLEERLAQRVETLSGGEKQMVALGRALMSQPELLLVDELSLGLAPIVAANVVRALVELNRQSGLTMVLVDESLARLNDAVDRLFFMRDGVLSADLSPSERTDAVHELYFTRDKE